MKRRHSQYCHIGWALLTAVAFRDCQAVTSTQTPWLLVGSLFLALPLCVGCGGETPKDAATLEEEAKALGKEVSDGESPLWRF